VGPAWSMTKRPPSAIPTHPAAQAHRPASGVVGGWVWWVWVWVWV
jgi:hypothetical protein